MFEVGDLVEFRYNLIPDLPVGIVTYAYMYNGYMWYKVQWAVGTGLARQVPDVVCASL